MTDHSVSTALVGAINHGLSITGNAVSVVRATPTIITMCRTPI